jgi:hypothetical protein
VFEELIEKDKEEIYMYFQQDSAQAHTTENSI